MMAQIATKPAAAVTSGNRRNRAAENPVDCGMPFNEASLAQVPQIFFLGLLELIERSFYYLRIGGRDGANGRIGRRKDASRDP